MSQPPKYKIFVLGFPKAGTSSLTFTLRRLGYKTAHLHGRGQLVGELMYRAHDEGRPLMHYLSEYDAITQMDACFPGANKNFWPQLEFYKDLYEQHPDGKFILNVRNLDRHIRSIKHWKQMQRRIKKSDIFRLPAGKGNDQELKQWISAHYHDVEAFFEGKPNFLKFDIEKDTGDILAQFLGVDSVEWVRKNAS